MKLITTNEELMAHIPNAIISVKGETSLFEKISVHLEAAENWVRDTFTSDKTFNTIVGYTEDNPIRVNLCRLVASEALHKAIPSLDLVFTPNGFAVTQTQNLTPASKQRVDRLIGSMLSQRDECIARLLPELVGASQWLKSAQAQFFGSTLFPDLSLIDQFPVPNSQSPRSRWERFLELRPQIIDLEASIAEEFISPELMSALRSENLRGDLTGKRSEIVRQVKAQVVGYLRSGSFNSRRLADIVNYIRLNAESFEEWHKSETAKLFAPLVFRNEKKASGYFF